MNAIIEKIIKLRALSRSANVNEAANAARMADRLLQQHQIDEAELEGVSDAHEAPCEAEHLYACWPGNVPAWESILSTTLATHYNCRSVFAHRDGKQVARIVGRPSDVETVRFQWAFFRAEVIRLCEVHGKGKGRAWRVSFCRGATRAIIEAMTEEKTASRVAASATALAVIDSRKSECDLAMRRIFPNLHSRSTTRSIGNVDGFEAGKRAGSSLNQRSQIGSGGTRLLK